MVTQSLYEDFIIFAYDTKEYTPNTLSNKLKHLKKFLLYCQEKSIHDNGSYKTFRKPSNETNNITLTIKQLVHLTSLDLSTEKRLQSVRDLFCIGCSTGLRFSDFSVLLPGNIQDDYITISTEKMDRTVRIPITDYTRQILMRYPNGQLPTMTNQEMNRVRVFLLVR
jgi:site-specific recombinase XerD